MNENSSLALFHYLLLLYVISNSILLALYNRIIKNKIVFSIINSLYLITSMIFIGDFTLGMDWAPGLVLFF